MEITNDNLLNSALVLSYITIIYNFIEGVVSVFFGYHYYALSLLGFGIDSLVEVISGIGVAHMIIRIKYANVTLNDDVERLTLNVTGVSFYILTCGLVLGSLLDFIRHIKPDTTLPGLIVSLVSIITM
jgi:hypothetical protein